MMDLFDSLVLGLMLAGSAAPTWVGVLGVVAIVASIVILTWQARGAWERRGDTELEVEPLPPSTTDRPALFEETAVRSRERRAAPRHRAHLVPAHPVRPSDDTHVIVPGSYGGDNETTAVLRLNQTPERSGRRG